MGDTVLFISAYDPTHYTMTTANRISRKIYRLFHLGKKQNIQSLLIKHHLSFIATDDVFISVDGNLKVKVEYDYVHQGSTFSFKPLGTADTVKDSGFYTNLRHAQSVFLDSRYFKISFTIWLDPFLVWINGQMYQVDAGAFMMNGVWFVVFEIIDYKTGKPLTKDDVGAKAKNYNLLNIEKYQFFDEEHTTNADMRTPEVIYEMISDFIWELSNKSSRAQEYSFVHDTVVFSNNIENIPDYLCKLMGTKEPVSTIKDISTVNLYEYYPQDGCSVISNFNNNEITAVLFTAIILEAVKLYIHVFQITNLEDETDIHRLVRNNMYLQNLFCSPNLPIETHNLLNCIKESVTYKKHFEALQLKISYLTVQNDLKKNRNATILNILLYVISLIGAIGTLDVIEEHFGVPFEQGFIVVILLFIFGLIGWIIEYQSNRRL